MREIPSSSPGDPSHSPSMDVRLVDYWFLQNPRVANCGYSQGRGDWGVRETAAPEVAGGGLISDKTDVWALGVCAFYWATGGKYPDQHLLHQMRATGIAALRSRFSSMWGAWLPSMIYMCLQIQPSHRASADRVYSFLVQSRGSKA